MNSIIVEAINNYQLLSFYYNSGSRIVEPHCYGITTAGNPGLRAFQVSGFSESGSLGWKMFDVSKASSIIALDKTFSVPRAGYKRNDKGMKSIYKQL
ncbi:MAG: hypothetical protein NT007_13955 [Candidatus Kapabacteria bacterium]|nr:hypothetical protein [Candidatus Kapabacteria bacterium]